MEENEFTLDMLEPLEGNLTDEATGEENLEGQENAGEASTTDAEPKGDGEGQTAPEGKVTYTQEELEQLLETGGKIDVDRLSPEGKLLQKSFQRGYTRKFEDLAEKSRQLEAEKTKVSDPKEQVYQQFKENPHGVVSRINTEIEKLADVSPTSEHFAESQKMIIRLQTMKEDMSMRRQSEIENDRNLETLVTVSEMELKRDIPDFAKKVDKLTDFALSPDVGLSIEEVRFLTDPYKLGRLATKLTKIINRFYDNTQAAKTAEGKIVKRTPQPLARGGSSTGESATPTQDPNKMTAKQYREWREGKRKAT